MSQETRKILVVDDEPIVTRSCERILCAEGYDVETTGSGRRGLAMAREGDFDLLMTDLKIPDLDGMTIVRSIRRLRADIPVVVITGYGTPETAAEARDLGVAVYIEKPFAPSEITDAVLHAWEHAEAAADPFAAEVRQVAARYDHDENALIQMLLDVQEAKGYLSKEWLFGISAEVGVPLNRVYQAATFYKAFSLEPRGKHIIRVCAGTACHVRGGETLAARIGNTLGIRPGRTTADGLFTLETVNCLGCCALGPVMAVDGAYYSNPSSEQMADIVNGCRQETE